MSTATTTATVPATEVDTFDYAKLGVKLAGYEYGARNTFLFCQAAFEASSAGADHLSIAKAVASALTERAGEARSFSRQAVDQRVMAYAFVGELQTPVAEVVAKAYTLAGKPSAATEFVLVAEAYRAEAGDDEKVNEALLITSLKAGITRANLARKAKAEPGAAGDTTSDEELAAGQSTVEETFEPVDQVCAYILAQAARTWDSAEAEQLLEAMATLAAHLAA
jgi:hypothetical protein